MTVRGGSSKKPAALCLIKMKNDNIIHSLKLFNEKADKLERLSFVETVFKYTSGVSIKINKREDGLYDLIQERTGPLDEAIDAFVLTFRFFIQDNDSISFRILADIYEKTPIDKRLKNDFISLREKINSYLDSNSALPITINEETLTHRKILETIIYGSLSHANPEKKKKYDFWMKTPLKAMIENDFVYSLAILFRAIKAICDVNQKVIEYLKVSENSRTIILA
jgi:hypothetical protein